MRKKPVGKSMDVLNLAGARGKDRHEMKVAWGQCSGKRGEERLFSSTLVQCHQVQGERVQRNKILLGA